MTKKKLFSILLTAIPIALFFLLIFQIRTLPQDMKAILHMSKLCVAIFIALMLLYESIRALQWHIQLRILKIAVPLRSELLSFIIGEAGKSLPVSAYFKTFYIHRIHQAQLGKTSAAATMSIFLEVFVSLSVLFVVGVGSWTPFIRIAILVLLLSIAFFAILGSRLRLENHAQRFPHLARIAKKLEHFHAGAKELLHPRALAMQLLCAYLYLFTAAGSLYIVMLGLHLHEASFIHAIAIYFFSLAAALVSMIPTNIGILEISGIKGLQLLGFAKNSALQTVLASRVLDTITPLLICGVCLIILHKEWRVILMKKKN